MLLFLTREAFCRRSREERRVGDGDEGAPKLFSELKLLFCQNILGEVVVLSKGDDWNGDESVRDIFCGRTNKQTRRSVNAKQTLASPCLTLVVWFQLGEFRRFSVGDISESGRGMLLLAGVGMVLDLDSRSGCSWAVCEYREKSKK